MPRYHRSIDVSAGTAESAAVITELDVDESFVHDASAFIDPGANDEVKVELRFGDRRLFPEAGPDPWDVPATADPAPVRVELPSSDTALNWKVWAPDADFDHVVLAWVDMLEAEKANPVQRLVNVFTGSRSFQTETAETE